MRVTTRSLLHSAQRLNDIVKDDQKVCFLRYSVFGFVFSLAIETY
jgi:hypothetical protein